MAVVERVERAGEHSAGETLARDHGAVGSYDDRVYAALEQLLHRVAITAGRDLDALVVVKPARQPRVDSAGLSECVDDQLAHEPVLSTPVP